MQSVAEVIQITAARREIAALDSLPGLKEYFDRTSALRHYAKGARKDRDLQNDIAEAMVRAAWKAGGLLREVERSGGGDRRSDEFQTSQAVTFETAYQAMLESAGGLLREVERKRGFAHSSRAVTNDTAYQEILQLANLDRMTAHRWQVISHIPEDRLEQFFAGVRDNGKATITMAAAYKLGKQFLPDPGIGAVGEDYELYLSDISKGTKEIKDASVDVIITDPPYPEDFLPVFSDLSKVAARVLRPGGACLVMSGQSFLPDVIGRLSEHLNYHWMLGYLTPGGQSVQLWDRHVNTFWKPVLWFVKGEYDGRWTGDVFKSDINDNDKRFHEWGQSESGMARLVEAFSQETETVLDPFLGGGATALAALTRNRRFIGADISQEAIDTTLRRLEAIHGLEAA